MAAFRGDDATLDKEIATLEAIARVRLRRATRELNDLDRELKVLKAEQARRRGRALAHVSVEASARADA